MSRLKWPRHLEWCVAQHEAGRTIDTIQFADAWYTHPTANRQFFVKGQLVVHPARYHAALAINQLVSRGFLYRVNRAYKVTEYGIHYWMSNIEGETS